MCIVRQKKNHLVLLLKSMQVWLRVFRWCQKTIDRWSKGRNAAGTDGFLLCLSNSADFLCLESLGAKKPKTNKAVPDVDFF